MSPLCGFFYWLLFFATKISSLWDLAFIFGIIPTDIFSLWEIFLYQSAINKSAISNFKFHLFFNIHFISKLYFVLLHLILMYDFMMNYALTLILDFVRFLRRPKNDFKYLPLKEKILSYLFYIVFFSVCTAFLLFFMILAFIYFVKNPLPNNLILYKSPIVFIIGGVIFAPIIEEIGFRLFFIYRGMYVAVSSILILLYFSLYLLYFNQIFNILHYIIFAFIIFVVISLLIYQYEAKIKRIWDKYFYLIFYGSAILFGFAHLGKSNSFAHTLYLFIFLFIFEKAFVGVFLGFIRMKYGILYSILFHSFHNFMFFILFFK